MHEAVKTEICKTDITKCMFIVNYLFLDILKKLWCKFPEDGGKRRTMYKLSNRRNT